MSCAKTAGRIEMPFGIGTRVDPRHIVLDGDPDPHGRGGPVGRREVRPIVKYRNIDAQIS